MTALGVEETDNEWLPNTRHCPYWCDKQHAEALSEGNGWERSQLHFASAGSEVLVELTHAGRHVRDFGGGWDLTIQQRPMSNGGHWGPALIDLAVSGPGPGAMAIGVTSGEARCLAAQLIAAADRMDLPRR